jgi:hypothetical protein
MERFLVDSNMILNLLFGIECYGIEAGQLWDWLKENKEAEVYLTEKDLQDIFFYVNNACGEEEALKRMQYLTSFFKICNIDQEILQKAYSYNNSNFEASVRIACQEIYKIDYIVSFHPTIYCFISRTANSITPETILSRYKNDMGFTKQKLEKIFSENYTEDISNPDLLKIRDYLITHFEVVCGNEKRHPSATIKLQAIATKTETEVEGKGNGPVDAMFKTIQNAILKINLPIKEHKVTQIYAISDGKGSDGIVAVRIGVISENKEIKKFFSHTDLVTAAVYAYVAILNELLY